MQTQSLEQRFVAPDMSRALRMLAEKFGEEAVLLSSRPVPEGVEVIGLPPGAKPSSGNVNELHTDRRKSDRRRTIREAGRPEAPQADNDELTKAASSNEMRSAASQLAQRIQGWSTPDSQNTLAAMSETLQQVQNLLSDNATTAVASTTDQLLPEPAQYVVMQRLAQSGLTMPVIRALVNTASGDTVEALWQDCRQRLANIMPIAGRDLFDQHSVVAVTGVQGSGKTELVSKLVARQAVEGRIDELAVICLSESADVASQRLASLTGVALYQATDSVSLAARLTQCKNYRRVLVDVNADKLTELRSGDLSIAELLVLPATGEKSYLQTVFKAYRQPQTIGCAVSFYDNCAAAGDLLSALISEQLPLFYLSSGLLLPEYLIVPQREQLVSSLLEQNSTASEVVIPTVNLPAKDATEQATG
jgi:flagellar biosynthesis protein FlhF